MAETRTYQGHTYTRNGPGEPWVRADTAPARSGVVIPNPYKASAEKRADQSQQNDATRLDLTAENNKREASRTRLQNPQDLRQEYEKLPEVQSYRVMLKAATAATNTAAGPQGDLSLTYAYAKAMDPLSSVREGEQASVAASQPAIPGIMERIKKQFGVDGAGNFTPETRNALRMEIFRATAALKPLYDRARADMSDNSRAVGVDPKEVIGRDDTATYAPIFREYGEKNGDDGTISRLIGGDPIKGANITVPETAPTTAAGFGADKTQAKIPDAMQKEVATYLNQNWGKIDPQAWSDYRSGLDRKYGLTPDPAAYLAEAPKMNDFARKGGLPAQMGPISAPDRPMSTIEQLRNDAISNPVGAGVAGAANMGGMGIPSLLAGDKYSALRKEYPKSVLAGELVGGVLGANKFGGLVRGLGRAAETRGLTTTANILTKPITSDVLFGGVTGANDAAGRGENPLVGAITGSIGGGAGNRIGNAIGKSFPGLVGFGRQVRALDETVPDSATLRDQASDLYREAEARGLTATPDDTFALADTTKNLLSQEGRLSPTGRLTDVQPKVSETYKLIDDYAGQPMSPTQIQTVRGVASDAVSSQDASERRIARKVLDNFDNWTDATNPELASGLSDARSVASRYLQGDKISLARDLADVRAGQFSNSGQGNALRTDFRQLDRAITKGTEQFAPGVESAVADVARGTPLSNALRFGGRFAPTGPVAAIPTLMAAAGGHAIGGSIGGAAGVGLGALAYGSRQLGQRLTNRAAQVAENAAYGGPDYTTALTRLLADAGTVGGASVTGAISGARPSTSDLIARLMLQSPAAQPIN